MNILVEDKDRGVAIDVVTKGQGPEVVMLASAMRGAADFAILQDALDQAGFRSIAVNMRGAGRSKGPDGDFTLRDIADDVAMVVRQLCVGPAHLVGHALGNIVARATASYRPDVVRSVTVMPCGGHDLGKYPVTHQVIAAMQRCHDGSLSEQERRDALSIAFFARGNDPGCWLDGWWPRATGISAAALSADAEEWWRAGNVPMLILQPLEDAMSPRQSGLDSKAAFGQRARYAEIPECGHAILPEQPERIAVEVIDFLRVQGLAAQVGLQDERG